MLAAGGMGTEGKDPFGERLLDDAAPSQPKRSAQAERAKWQLITAMVFCFLFMIGEVIGGYYAGSLAIMTE